MWVLGNTTKFNKKFCTWIRIVLHINTGCEQSGCGAAQLKTTWALQWMPCWICFTLKQTSYWAKWGRLWQTDGGKLLFLSLLGTGQAALGILRPVWGLLVQKGYCKTEGETSRRLTKMVRGQDCRFYKNRSGKLACWAWKTKRESNSTVLLLEGEL